MAREPSDRHPSAAALRDALTALDLGAPDQTEPLAAVGGEATRVIAVLPPAPTDPSSP